MTATDAAPSTSTTYPPAPWDLTGQMHSHLLLVRQAEIPATPDGFDPLIVAGRGLVLVGWVDYQGGSVLNYGELFAAVVGRFEGKPTATVTHMWVDSPASRAGGRELWGYPKELADFTLSIDPSGTAGARDESGELARGTFRALFTSPKAITSNSGTVQPRPGGLAVVKAIVRARPAIGRGTISAPASSPLAFVNSATKLMSLGLRDFHFTFGV